MDVARSAPQGVTTMWMVFTRSLNWECRRMEHAGCGTPGKAFTHSVPDKHSLYPVGQHSFAFFTKRVMSMGLAAIAALMV